MAFLSPCIQRTGLNSFSSNTTSVLLPKPQYVPLKHYRQISCIRMVSNLPRESVTSPASSTSPVSIPVDITFSDPKFMQAVSGEWFGYECGFSARTGASMQIEERYVPDAYREWGVAVKGFDCLTSSTIDSNEALLVKRTRALPSVGCEADAVIPEVAERRYFANTAQEIGVGFEDGSVTNGPDIVLAKDFSTRWHMCLASTIETGHRARLEFGRVDEKIGKIDVFLETRDGPFNGGEILPGCGGKNQSFADDPTINVEDVLVGTWDVHRVRYEKGKDDHWSRITESFVLERNKEAAKKEATFVLPKGLTMGITCSDEEGMVVFAGRLEENDHRTVLRRMYNNEGKLSSVIHDIEMMRSG